MPELPEVETLVRDLCTCGLKGLRMKKMEVFWPGTLAEPDVEIFCYKLKGQTIQNIERRGKWIIFTLSSETLLVHLRMTGKFLISEGRKALQPHERVRILLSDGRTLHFEDQRKFGKWYLLKHPDQILGRLGVEPLSNAFTKEMLKLKASYSSKQCKPFLLDQTTITGLGNIYADEALWEARIHPRCKTNSLNETQIHALHRAIINVLQKGIAYKGTTLGSARANYFSVSGRRGSHQEALEVFRRDGESCSRCGNIITRIIVAQRSTHLCTHCQK